MVTKEPTPQRDWPDECRHLSVVLERERADFVRVVEQGNEYHRTIMDQAEEIAALKGLLAVYLKREA